MVGQRDTSRNQTGTATHDQNPTHRRGQEVQGNWLCSRRAFSSTLPIIERFTAPSRTYRRVDRLQRSDVGFWHRRREIFVMAREQPPAVPGSGIDVAECERRIGYAFRDPSLLVAAATHASGARHRLASNERLEFLGDAILGFVVCERLFRTFPESLEGDLTRIKSVVVSRETCSRLSGQLGLADFLIVGKGLAVADAVPDSVLSDVFESIVAAIYLDGGFDAVKPFIEQLLGPEIDKVVSGELGSNHKSLLQQWAQRDFGLTPTYEVLAEEGPDHSKSFRVSAQIGRRSYSPAWGRNKKEAEQRAASNALLELQGSAGVSQERLEP